MNIILEKMTIIKIIQKRNKNIMTYQKESGKQ